MRTLLCDVIGNDASKPWAYAKGHKSFMRKKRGVGKYTCGPQAFSCPCCTIMDPTKCKPFIRRAERRKAKLALAREFELE